MIADLDIIRLGDGVTLAPSTQADYDFILAHLREGDRAETLAVPDAPKDSPDVMERSWTIRDGEAVVGFVATRIPPDASALSRARFMVELTTDHVWRVPAKYVRFSRRVFAAVAERTFPWVRDFYALPMAAYAKAVRWHERTLRMRRVCDIPVHGTPHILYHITREEILRNGNIRRNR